MKLTTLTAISPLDGRYAQKTDKLRSIVSEYGLIYFRLFVEIRWLITLTETADISEAKPLTTQELHFLESIYQNFDLESAIAIKAIEKTTNHDVKAIEYYIKEQLTNHATLSSLIPFIHFSCTSEDINNLAYALMLWHSRKEVLLPIIDELLNHLTEFAQQYADISMLSRTHGQPATPTTLGKEFANFAMRLQKQRHLWSTIAINGKFNGAVGNFNAHYAAYPDADWLKISQNFVESLGLNWNAYTTQIEPHDDLANWLHTLTRLNTILIDFSRDIWGYISLNYFSLKRIANEVGSSTMPHKINPIDFENAEGNLGLANALAEHLARKLPISRWQRDLSDSTVLRNLGNVAGYSLIAYQATLKGLSKLAINHQTIQDDIKQHWEILAEAIQTVMRRYGIVDAYEQLKTLTRGEVVDQVAINHFIQSLPLPSAEKQRLCTLTPDNYLGCAKMLAEHTKLDI